MLRQVKVAFLGSGQMAEALLRGILKSQTLKPNQVILSDIRAKRLSQLKKTYKVKIAKSNIEAVRGANFVILSVKPQQLSQVLREISSSLDEGKTVISIAAGVSISHIFKILGKQVPLIRVMPNSPALVGQGVSVISPGNKASKKTTDLAVKLFSSVGAVLLLKEKYQNAACALSGSGPAYFYLFTEALIKAGRRAGLSSKAATQLAYQTIVGSAAMLEQTKKSPAELRGMVASKGGTTEAALKIFKKQKLEKTVEEAVRAAVKRAEELT